MDKITFIKVKLKILRLGNRYTKLLIRTFDAEMTLTEYVNHLIIKYDIESDPAMLKKIIDLLPNSLYKYSTIERYIKLLNAKNQDV